jgi:hypothetical protein
MARSRKVAGWAPGGLRGRGLRLSEPERQGGPNAGPATATRSYRDLTGPWFDYLIVSPDEMATILEGTPWRIHRLLEGGTGYYVAILG